MEWHGGTTCSIIVTGTLESLIRLFIIMFYSQQLGVHDISWRLWTRQEKIFTVRMQKMSTFCISIPCWSYSPIHYSGNRPWRFTVSSWQTAGGLKFQTRNLQHTIYQWFCMMGLDSAGVDITICFFFAQRSLTFWPTECLVGKLWTALSVSRGDLLSFSYSNLHNNHYANCAWRNPDKGHKNNSPYGMAGNIFLMCSH